MVYKAIEMMLKRMFNRSRLNIKSLKDRESKINITSILDFNLPLPVISQQHEDLLAHLTERIIKARSSDAPVILIYGAHLFRNGLSPYIIRLMESDYINHLVTNGAGVIHDWEMAYHGETTEDVIKYLDDGQFGIWEETGFFQNLSIILGAANGLGYGESIGKMISDDFLNIPDVKTLKCEIQAELNEKLLETSAAKVMLINVIEQHKLKSGIHKVQHNYKKNSIVYNGYKLGIPFSVCPGIGYDIIYTHPINNGAAIGQSALHDFLSFTDTVSRLENGVVIVIGSAVMASQITEKALSMAKNIAKRHHRSLNNYYLAVVDIQPGEWDWKLGEPTKENPAYYLRFCKSFSRMGGEFQYFELDNRKFVQHLYHQLLKHNLR